MNKIRPKQENEDKGFHYTVSRDQLRAYREWSLEDKLKWIWETNELMMKIKTPEEIERTRQNKHKIVR